MSATDSPLGDIDVNAILQEAKLNNRNAEEDVALDDDELLNAVNRVSAILARSFEQDEEKDASNEETEEERQARIEELITDLVKNGGAGTQHVHIHEYVHTDDKYVLLADDVSCALVKKLKKNHQKVMQRRQIREILPPGNARSRRNHVMVRI